MSQPSQRLNQAKLDLDEVLLKREEGTPTFSRQVPRVDTAMQRALDRAGAGYLPRDGERGGSSDPDGEDARDRRLAERVKAQAEKDAWAISTLTARIVRDLAELRVVVNRQADIVSPGKQKIEGALPGCAYCQRKEGHRDETIGGHFEGVSDKAPKSGLCRACNDFKNATNGPPPVMWCHLRHTKGMAHANRWLAKEFPKLLESVQRKAKSKSQITAEDLELRTDQVIVSQPDGTVAA